jgi:hypothetical protein
MEEPLLRFPFVYSLVNPCDFKSDVLECEQQDKSSKESMRNLARNGEISLAQQVFDFLSPFRQLIEVQLVEPNSSDDSKMKEQSTQELKLVVAQALQLIYHFYSSSVSLVMVGEIYN